MSTTGKTPVSILQETLLRQQITPVYDLLYSGVGMHQGMFTYRVTAGEIMAIGSGRSKKEAKHIAAKLALEQMKNHPEPVDDELLTLDVTSPYETSLKDNAVGTLGETCIANDLPVPVYNLVREDGPPHAKTFVFSCKVSTMEEISMGRTKKQAKQLAAYKMLIHFKDLSLSELPTPDQTEEQNSEKDACKQQAHINQHRNSVAPIGSRVEDSDCLEGLWTDEQLTKLKMLEVPYETPVESLEEVCKDLELIYCFKDFPPAKGICLHLLTKSTVRFLNLPPNEKEKCAIQAIQYLKVMTGAHGVPVPIQKIFFSHRL